MQCTGDVPKTYGYDFRSLSCVCLHLLGRPDHSFQNYAGAFASFASGLSILRAERFYAKPSKCQFFASELEFVGFVVSAKGISPQESKLKAVREWPTPTSAKDIRTFLGICGFYQRFVQNYSTLVAPLTDLLKKEVEWIWSPYPYLCRPFGR